MRLDVTCERSYHLASHTNSISSLDCTRQLESHEKPYPNCFAVGPLVDSGALRTYYISCCKSTQVHNYMIILGSTKWPHPFIVTCTTTLLGIAATPQCLVFSSTSALIFSWLHHCDKNCVDIPSWISQQLNLCCMLLKWCLIITPSP